jgi:hypothetical protein
MAIKYFPFLKAKQSELLALDRLNAEEKSKISPVFDIAANTYEDNSDFLFTKIGKAVNLLSKKVISLPNGFYIDHFDVDPRILLPDGSHPYAFTLGALKQYGARAVVGLDRDHAFMLSASSFILANESKFAVRLLPEDLLCADETDEALDGLFNLYGLPNNRVVFVFDLRHLPSADADLISIVGAIDSLVSLIKDKYGQPELVITGSSIPTNISEHIATGASGAVDRVEAAAWEFFHQKFKNLLIGLGDYTIVSPEYVEIPPYLFRTVMTAKGVYTQEKSYYFSRKKSLEKHGYAQYYDVADDVVGNTIFRNGISHGDSYIENISARAAKTPGSPGSWLSAGINTHLTYMLSFKYFI